MSRLYAFSNMLWDIYVSERLELEAPEELRSVIAEPSNYQQVKQQLSKEAVLRESLGSSPSNVALAHAGLGEETYLIGPQTRDAKRRMRIQADFSQRGLRYCPIVPELLYEGECLAFPSSATERRFYVQYPGFAPSTTLSTTFPFVQKDDWLVSSSYEFTSEAIREFYLEQLTSLSGRLVLDLGDSYFVQRNHKSLLKLSEHGVSVVFGGESAFQTLSQYVSPDNFAELCVISTERGVVEVRENGKVQEFPIQRVEEVDTTGAGDTFLAAFLWAYGREKSVEKAVLFASLAASRVVQFLGPHLPVEEWEQLKMGVHSPDS